MLWRHVKSIVKNFVTSAVYYSAHTYRVQNVNVLFILEILYFLSWCIGGVRIEFPVRVLKLLKSSDQYS